MLDLLRLRQVKSVEGLVRSLHLGQEPILEISGQRIERFWQRRRLRGRALDWCTGGLNRRSVQARLVDARLAPTDAAARAEPEMEVRALKVGRDPKTGGADGCVPGARSRQRASASIRSTVRRLFRGWQ